MISRSTFYKCFAVAAIAFFIAFEGSAQESKKTTEAPSKAEARKDLRKARKNSSNAKYESAGSKYLSLLKHDPNNYDYNAELGLNYFNSPYYKTQAIPYLEKALKKADADSKVEFYYPLGVAYRMVGRYDEAIEALNSFLEIVEKKGTYLSKKEEADLIKEVKRDIESCNYAKAEAANPSSYQYLLDTKPHEVTVNKLSSALNSPADDYSPVFLNNDSTIIFTSTRAGGTGKRINWDGKFYEDIYISNRTGADWSTPVSIGSSINTKRHDASNSISSNKRQLYIYRGDRNGTIYVSTRLNEGKWSKPKKLKSNINTKAWETSLGISLSDTVIYFSSDREGGHGGRDLYKARKLSDHLWSTPENLGPEINTLYEEDAPFIAPDGKRLYFSSTGHNSIGGFDVFVSTLQNGKWGKPENLGRPVNSENHDIYFVTSADAKKGYLSSSRVQDTLNDMNIYIVEIKKTDTIKEPVVAVADTSETKPKSDTIAKAKEPKVEAGKTMTYNTLTFSKSQANLTDESKPALKSVVDYMKGNPSHRIEVNGYASSEGEINYNLQLSKRRAASVSNYLISQGISKSRIKSNGFGIENPVASNDTEEGRQKNRRVEIRILK